MEIFDIRMKQKDVTFVLSENVFNSFTDGLPSNTTITEIPPFILQKINYNLELVKTTVKL